MKLITFEGTSGSGKSSMAQFAFDYLQNNGMQVKLGKFPTEAYRDTIQKERYKEERNPEIEAELFVKDFEVFMEKYKNNNYVVSDRSWITSCADSSFGNVSITDIISLHEKSHTPDHLFILNCEPEIAMKRIIDRNNVSGKEISKRETIRYLRHMQESYLNVAKFFPEAHIIDSNRTFNEVQREVKKYLDEMIRHEYTNIQK